MSDPFSEPYVDVDEWRETPVRHRYVHGGFAPTDTRFSIYLPSPEKYEGRFFQHVTPVPDSEYLAQGQTGEQDKIGFSIASGGYFLETNGGGAVGGFGSGADPTIAAYRANAAAAEYSRVVARQMYGQHRTYGYLFGGSGGGFRTMGAAENTSGVWDGFVPYVIGSPMAIPNMFTVRMHAMRVLRECFEQIVDAVEPGGSGEMYAGLDDEQRDALLEVTRMGFPPRSWFGHRTMGMHAFPVLYRGVRMADPSYFEDFWSTPGYLGHTPPPSLLRDRVQHRCEILEVVGDEAVRSQPGAPVRGGVDTAWRGSLEPSMIPVAARLSTPPPVDVQGGELVVLSGAAEGERLILLEVVKDIATFGPADPDVLVRLQPGDAVEVDNSCFLAAQTYHRHQVPSPDFQVWDQFRNPDGSPTYPQRPLLLGPLFAAGAAGTVQTGRFTGKMIVVESLLDREALPWQADWYRSKVQEHLGEATDDHFRVWFTDNALHGDEQVQEDPTHAISYLGVLHQALRDLSSWVEQGIAPPPTTSYQVVDGQVVVPADARQRGGIQPVVSVTANGGARADVAVGDTVTLRVTAAVPDDAGGLVSIEWDFDGAGFFPVHEQLNGEDHIVMERQQVFSAAGTYFVTVRVASQRDADPSTPYARLQNLARTRIVVSA